MAMATPIVTTDDDACPEERPYKGKKTKIEIAGKFRHISLKRYSQNHIVFNS
jgi:hypothetical protein